jgi:hypothetical protein
VSLQAAGQMKQRRPKLKRAGPRLVGSAESLAAAKLAARARGGASKRWPQGQRRTSANPTLWLQRGPFSENLTPRQQALRGKTRG